MSKNGHSLLRSARLRAFLAVAALGVPTSLPAPGIAQGFDICGCASSPTTLGAFNSADAATWPAGTTVASSGISPDVIGIPLPADGVLIFDSFLVSNSPSGDNALVRFVHNASNTPVTLLVRGDASIGASDAISVSGFQPANATQTTPAFGGTPGPGGYSGGDGAFLLVNLATDGGAGIGPGGGLGAVAATSTAAGGGTFFGVPELRPLRGGSGGGGGFSSTSSGLCAAGGGGGGGGAILIAANGAISIAGWIEANGGASSESSSVNNACGRPGGGGSGGAIRLLANSISGAGTLQALGGTVACCTGGSPGGPGSIRMESFSNSFGTNVTPPGQRLPSPGPIVNPVDPTVAITQIAGAATPENPVGYLGAIDIIVPAPGAVQIDVRTTDVPSGTDVEIAVKPKLDGAPVVQRLTLQPGDCVSGTCTTELSVDLDPGSYIVEARATFEAP